MNNGYALSVEFPMTVFKSLLVENSESSQKGRFQKIMKSRSEKEKETVEKQTVSDDTKVKFPLYIFPDTIERIDMLYEADNCKSKTCIKISFIYSKHICT